VPLTDWINGLKQEVAPQLDAARKLRTLAEQHVPNVLIVDDDGFQCKLLERLLANQPYTLSFAHSGAETFALLARERPDLILMDVQLPDTDGVTITAKLKTSPVLMNVPVMMITGHSERSILEASLKAGAVDFVVKPFDREVLLKKISRYLAIP
jgi:CheY-like chemotaxis protein